MRSPTLIIAIPFVSLIAAFCLTGPAQERHQANKLNPDAVSVRSVVKTQLKGLKSVTVVVTYVDLDSPTPKGIEEQMESTATKLLTEAGISSEGEQGAFLCITAVIYLTEEAAFSDYAMVHIQTILCDDARLVRDPSLANPHGYVTWSDDWVLLSRRDKIREGVLEVVDFQVDHFCGDVRTAAQF